MSGSIDLNAVVPASNANQSSDSEYEVVSGSESSSAPAPKASSKTATRKIKVKTPKQATKPTPVRKRNKASGRQPIDSSLPPIQTTNHVDHALSQPAPLFIQKSLNEKFNKVEQIPLETETFAGYNPETFDPLASNEGFEEKEGFMSKVKFLWQPPWSYVIVIIVVMIVTGIGVWIYLRWKWNREHDPISEETPKTESKSLEGGDKDLKSITNVDERSKELPPSYENKYYDENQKDTSADEAADKMDKELRQIPKGKSEKIEKKNNELPKRDKHGRFVKS